MAENIEPKYMKIMARMFSDMGIKTKTDLSNHVFSDAAFRDALRMMRTHSPELQSNKYFQKYSLPQTETISYGPDKNTLYAGRQAEYNESAGTENDQTSAKGAGENFTTGSFDDLPSNSQNSYKGYEGNGWNGNYSGQAPGTKAGKMYQNADDLLPKTDSAGNRITYREFDINSPTQGVGRDAERFVVGSDGSVYYTDSHYGQRTSPAGLPPFVKIK